MKTLEDISEVLEGPALDILEEEPEQGPVPSAFTPEEIEEEVEASRERLPEEMAKAIRELRTGSEGLAARLLDAERTNTRQTRQIRTLRARVRRLERIVGCAGAPFREEDQIDDDEPEGSAE